MIIETKEIYKCEHCNKLYQRKWLCEKHELICTKNPENKRACFGCNNLKKVDQAIFFDTWNGEGSSRVKICFCKKLNQFVYPPKVEIKNNMIDLGDVSNEPMPKECSSFVMKDYDEDL